MRGELGIIWPSTWKEIYVPLMRHPTLGRDVALDLYREYVTEPKSSMPISQLSQDELAVFDVSRRHYNDAISDPSKARPALRRAFFTKSVGENFAVSFLERSFSVLSEYDDANFSNLFLTRLIHF